jgi:hypothetical protein
MTAIAAFKVDGCPVVFGDLLVTGPTGTKRSVGLPAIGDAYEVFGDSGWSIQGLKQKVVIINEKCVLAWAGSYIAAKVAIEELRGLSVQTTLTADGVRAFLAAQPDVAQHGVSFVGWVLEDDSGRFTQFRHDAEVINGSALGRVILQGSGVSAIREFVNLWGAGERRERGEVNAAARALSTGFSMAGMLLRAELQGGVSAPTLLSMFGGGYEVAAFINGAFRKVGNLTFLIWSANVSAQGVELTLPQLIVKQIYSGDELLLRSARVEMENEQLHLVDEQGHIISPMFESDVQATEAELLGISYDSPLLCHCIIVEGSALSGPMLYTRVQQTSLSSEPTISFKNFDGQFVISVSNAFLQDLASSLQASLSPKKSDD